MCRVHTETTSTVTLLAYTTLFRSASPAASFERLIAGSALPAGDYLRARRVRSDLRRRGEAIFDDVDVLLCPATPTAAPRVAPPVDDMWADGDRLWLERVARNLILFNLLGWPAVVRSEEHTSELQSLMRISYAVFC